MSATSLSATEQLARLASGELSSVDLTCEYLDRIERIDSQVRSYLRIEAESALESAKRIDDARTQGQSLGPLAGLPVAVKDILCSQGELTTCGSKMLAGFRPPYDATAVARLKAADAVLIGRTNMDEFAMGGSTETSAFSPTRNPWDLDRSPGGSSGGSAACVAASLAPVSVGTDTGGSIRQPASLCGITGLKPTYGRVSRYGLVAFASSLDQVGPLARNARDAALLLEVLAGHDPLDSTSADVDVPRYSQTVAEPLEGLRIGLVREHFSAALSEETGAAVQEAVRVFESLGATVRDISLPHNKYGVATYYIIAPSEASSNLARYDGVHYGHRTDEHALAAEMAAERKQLSEAGDAGGLEQMDTRLVRMYRKTRSEGFGVEVKRRIMLGTYALSAGYYDAYYVKALKVRRLIRNDFDEAFRDVDVVLGPTSPSPAFKLGEKLADPLSMYLVDLYTVSANLAGIPGISIPCGASSDGLPIGLQLQAPAFEEERLLRAAYMFQQATDWHQRTPEI